MTTKKPADEKMEIEEEDINVEEEEKKLDLPKMMRENILTLVRAVELDDKNLIRRVWRRNYVIRKDLSLYDFQQVLADTLPKGSVHKSLINYLDKSIAAHEHVTSGVGKIPTQATKVVKEVTEEPLLEVQSYLTLFIVSTLLKYSLYEDALSLSTDLLEHFKSVNRQTLDSFVAKTYSFYSIASEKLKLKTSHYDEELLTTLISGQKTSGLRLYDQSQAILINLVLRRYISDKMYNEARMFIDATEGTPILESSNVGNNAQVRYLYYTGKVSAVEANYSESDLNVTRAIRKAPTNTGLGFRLTINKLNIVTKLLMGEVPDRSLFDDIDMKLELKPYFKLVKSVRNGSVADFDKVTKQYNTFFERDDLMTLVNRLRSSVVKTALKNINLAYSKISFKEIMKKLELKSEKDAELVCAKAIRDSIIENAIIDSASKSLFSTETIDVYSTSLEPKDQFNNRINFCLNVHNSALKAHKYPPNSHKAQETAESKIKPDEDIVSDDDF